MTDKPMESPTDERRFPEHGRGCTFSLATILLLTTVVAIFLAAARGYHVRPKPKPEASTNVFPYDGYLSQPSPEEAAARRAVTGAVIGLIAGIIVALRRRCWPAGLVLALFLGPGLGAAAAVPLAEPRNFPVAVAGAAVLLALGIAVRGLSKGVRS